MYQLTDKDSEAIVLAGGSLPAGTVIHDKSRFWTGYQEFLSGGGIPRPMKPSRYHAWVGEAWVEDVDWRESDEAAASLAETDMKQARSVDDIIAYITDGTPLPAIVTDRHASRKAARMKLRSKKG